ncbi:MAG: YihY/virulence factor BrkB family protein [Angelakisella sp.]
MKTLQWLEKRFGKNKLYRLIRTMTLRYFRHNVGNSAAALTYYMIFAFFPFLIFLSSLLGMMDIQAIPMAELSRFIPQDILELMSSFLTHVQVVSSPQLMVFGLIFSVYFPIRAVSSLMDFIEQAYEVPEKRSMLHRGIIIIIFAMGLTAAIIASIVVLVAGRDLLLWASAFLPSIAGIELWSMLRFILLGMALLLLIVLLYLVAPGCVVTVREALPGAIGSLFCWLIYTVGFSFYVEHMASYSVVYGSIGAIIVLLIWLYATSVTIIMGAELNAALRHKR